jgi:hypothetical protein
MPKIYGNSKVEGNLEVGGSFSVASTTIGNTVTIEGPGGSAFTKIIDLKRNGSSVFYIDQYAAKFGDTVYLNTIYGHGSSGITFGNQSGGGRLIYLQPFTANLAIGYLTTTNNAALDILSQSASSTYIAFRVRNNDNDSDFISILGDGNINVGTSTTGATVSSTFNVYSGFGGGNYLKLINGTSNFNAYQGIDMTHTLRTGYFSLETAGNQGSSITRFRGGGSTNANAKITAYIDHPGDVDKTGHWHFRTQVHLGDAYRSFDSNYGQHTLLIENGVVPIASATNSFIQYSADITSGNAAPHFRTENGSVVKLYQETTGVLSATFSSIGGTPLYDLDTYDGYTIQQVVRALRNHGLLA